MARHAANEIANAARFEWTRKGLNDAGHIGGAKTLGTLLTNELDRFPFVQSLIAVLLDRGEMDEHVFAAGALNKTETLCPIEPLDYAFTNALLLLL